jgi:hypothetical protein
METTCETANGKNDVIGEAGLRTVGDNRQNCMRSTAPPFQVIAHHPPLPLLLYAILNIC